MELPDVPWYKSCRFNLAMISALGYTFFYVLRIDLSMAIVCMVKNPTPSHSIVGHFDNSTLIEGNRTVRRTVENRDSFLTSVINDSFAMDRCGGASTQNKTSLHKVRLTVACQHQRLTWTSTLNFGINVLHIQP